MNQLSQKGMSVLSMLVTVVLVAGGLLLTIKIVPLYIDDMTISKAVEAMSAEEDLYNWKKDDIRTYLRRKMAADYSRDLADDEITISKEKRVIKVDIVYEARVPAVYNLDIVAKFAHHIETEK